MPRQHGETELNVLSFHGRASELFPGGHAPIALDYECRLFQSLYWSGFDLDWDEIAQRVPE